MTKKGKFITIYGINNIGKSTQAKLLVARLEKEGHMAKYVKYPIYDMEPTGPFLNKILRGGGGGEDGSGDGGGDGGVGGQKISEDELQLWFILNRYQFEPQIKEWIQAGCIVVAEDFTGTGIAWGVAKGLDKKWLKEANKFLLKEDFAIMLNGKRHLKSKEKNHVHEQNDQLIEKCTKVHEELAEEFGWKKIEVRDKIEDTAKDLWERCLQFLQS